MRKKFNRKLKKSESSRKFHKKLNRLFKIRSIIKNKKNYNKMDSLT
jgi:hypothetical protein